MCFLVVVGSWRFRSDELRGFFRTALGLFHDFVLLSLVLRKDRYQILWDWSQKLEILGKFHKVVQFDGLILIELVTATCLDAQLFDVCKLSERV